MRSFVHVGGLALLGAALLGAPAHALSGKGLKAQKFLDKYEAGDVEALEKSRAFIDEASGAAKDDAEVWALRGHVYQVYATNRELAQIGFNAWAESLEAYERAAKLDESETWMPTMAPQMAALESANLALLNNDVEARQWDAAYERLGISLRLEVLQGRRVDPERRASTLKLGTLICGTSGKLDEARTHHQALVDDGRWHAPTTMKLARAIEEGEGVDAALAFLAPHQEAHPQDTTLLGAELDMLLEAERVDEAVARLDTVADVLANSVGTLFFLAERYHAAGAREKAVTSWTKVVELDPRHVESLVALANDRIALAEITAKSGGRASTRERNVRTLRSASLRYLEQAREARSGDKEVLGLLAEQYALVGEDEKAAEARAALEKIP